MGGRAKGPKGHNVYNVNFERGTSPLVTSYTTPISRMQSFLFFPLPGPSRLQKLSARGPGGCFREAGDTHFWIGESCATCGLFFSLRVALHPRGGLGPEVFRVASDIWGQPSLGGNMSHVLLPC
ncbi:unnamed protein product [Onchocerca flexuosa]|uniref:Uncharacterized protein n=1 Tax=Onchocerca flexuosa TaxID=387005 RepID=A0A183I7Z7_9BILA|nr:unnamed protein product [Onchocerca flexuosa]